MKSVIKAVTVLLFVFLICAAVLSGIQALKGNLSLLNLASLTAFPVGILAGVHYAFRHYRGQPAWERAAMFADAILSALSAAFLLSAVIAIVVPLSLIPAAVIQFAAAVGGVFVTFGVRYTRSFLTAAW